MYNGIRYIIVANEMKAKKKVDYQPLKHLEGFENSPGTYQGINFDFACKPRQISKRS